MTVSGPLLTRTELRKLREAEEERLAKEGKLAEKEYSKKEDEIEHFYRKERKKQEKSEVTKSRVVEKQKVDKRSHWLNRAIIIAVILLVLLTIAIIKL
ncbi:MAG: cell wall synthase accessory phosphoprotein MacP [Lactobacillales bacterium]|jgi:type IV secretory pathway component VirB8|nr:cell wall synthase accessory phosphoprotein MacP [Lactobacillales bacterium]